MSPFQSATAGKSNVETKTIGRLERSDRLERSERGERADRNDRNAIATGATVDAAVLHLPRPLANIVCFSHLRWRFVYQRPQHLLSRAAKESRVWFVEEPIWEERATAVLDVSTDVSGVTVVVPHMPTGGTKEKDDLILRDLVDGLFAENGINDFGAWYYSPMSLDFTRHLEPSVVLYDCMDELSAFLYAPAELKDRERELMERADLVFTGGLSLYEAKRDLHPAVHAFPSSVDVAHFARARTTNDEPEDQRAVPARRVGFYGVVDERFDTELLRAVATQRPDWNFIVLGPVVKIDPATLPQGANIHYLGQKTYAELPAYVSGWDVAMMPFALNASTKFISPTKTPEYLAAGRPVVSTPIRDVVRSYGECNLVEIAEGADAFALALDAALARREERGWLERVDGTLSADSWDLTWNRMSGLLRHSAAKRQGA